MWALVGVPIIDERWGLTTWDGVCLTLTNTPLSTWVIMPNLIAVGQTVRAYMRRFAGKWALRDPTFKVTQGYRN